ncbi:MAG TPA: Hsp70 family protein [Kofleriaceae bacterium]|nr:Hsp70 family protein [Kofleriaceae bacterium]
MVPPKPDTSDGIPIVDATELGDLSARERELLAEDVELEPWEKRRILAVVRALESSDYLDLLSLPPGASNRELKRAYYDLSRQLHPDRFFGRRLGSFAPVLDRVFAAVSQVVKSLSDSRTVIGVKSIAAGPRRRRAERLVLRTPASVAGLDGGEQRMEALDLSQGGAFLAGETAAPCRPGQPIEVALQPPGARAFALPARVVWTRPPEVARQSQRDPGIGVRFEAVAPSESARLDELLVMARHCAPEGAEDQAESPEKRRLARGTDRLPLAHRVIGIDFGTTYTSVAAAVANRVQILPWPDGSRAIPSVVAFTAPGRAVVGAEARERQLRDPRRVVSSAKRLLGRSVDDPELAAYFAQAAFDRARGPDGNVMVEMWGEPYATPQLCGYLLDAARVNAERVLGHAVDRAVVTVPVSFSAERIQLLRRAGQLARLEIVEVIEEPSAAALASRHTPGFGGVIGVYDFGGGTFDFSVVEATGGDFRVLTTAGDSWLGGDDLDYAVAEAASNLFWRVHGIDLRLRVVEWQHLLTSAEKAKRDLSVVEAATLFVPEVVHTPHGAQDLRIKVTRDRVEPIWAPAIERSLHTCISALASLGMRPSDLSAIYLSGGTSYVPAVRRALSQRFKLPIRIGAPPDHAVCLGAGIHAAHLERRVPTLLPARG